MEFELKHYQAVGTVQYHSENDIFSQYVNVTVGVVGCPYEDINTQKTIIYQWDGTIPTNKALFGMESFCKQWVTENYPNTSLWVK